MSIVYADTYEQTKAEIAQFIVDHAPAGLRDRDLVKGKNTCMGWYLEFRRPSSEQDPAETFGDLSASAHVRLDSDYDTQDDAEGNQWRRFHVKAEVSWPSWGGTDVELASERLGLMQEVCRFAAEVQARFGFDLRYKLFRTAEERRQSEENMRIAVIHSKIRAAIDKSVKGMRVGNERCVSSGDIPAGTYDLILGDKEYRANVSQTEGTRFLYFTRTA